MLAGIPDGVIRKFDPERALTLPALLWFRPRMLELGGDPHHFAAQLGAHADPLLRHVPRRSGVIEPSGVRNDVT